MGLLMLFAQNGARAALSTFALSIAYILYFCVKRLYFHPLSKYPGPFLGKLTDFYAAYHAWKGDIHVDMWRCHEKYGPYVRYAPERLNINNITALQDIYGGSKNFQKSPNYRVLRHQAANTLTMINKKEHARRRRIMSQGVSDASMRSHEPTILTHIKKCFDTLVETDEDMLGVYGPASPGGADDGWTPARNMSNWFNWLTFDIMADLIFGLRYNLISSVTNRNIPEAIEDSNVRVSVLLQSPMIRQFGRIDRWLFPKAIEARNQFLRFVGSLVDQCMKPECAPATRTVVSILKTATDPVTGDKLTAREILAESTTLCVAGADTSSTALASIFFYLSHNPRVYDRVTKDVRSTFESTEEICLGSKLNSLTYLRACIDEALRMSPPAGSSLFRQVQTGGATVGEEFFPPGVEVGVPIYGIHHNSKYYPSPFTYMPERWIINEDGSNRASVELAKSAFCPFSIGTRSCIGKGMAMVELTLTMAYALFTLDFKLAEGDVSGGHAGAEKGWDMPSEFHLEDHITGSKNGPMLRFKRRGITGWPKQDDRRPQLPKVVTTLRPEFRPRSASSPCLDFSVMWKSGAIQV